MIIHLFRMRGKRKFLRWHAYGDDQRVRDEARTMKEMRELGYRPLHKGPHSSAAGVPFLEWASDRDHGSLYWTEREDV